MTSQLSYVPLSSSINPSFWNKLSELKLEVFKLDEGEKYIWGYFTLLCSKNCPSPFLEVDSTSFNLKFSGQNMYLPFHGKLFNKNTLEQFKECDKMELINKEGYSIYEKIKNEDALRDPSILNSFFILSFADLKKYHYYYWFAFPVPKGLLVETIDFCPITTTFSTEMLNEIFEEYRKLDDKNKCYFLLTKKANEIQINTLETRIKNLRLEDCHEHYFVFHNISSDSNLVGSQLRNFILLILNECKFLANEVVNFISLSLTRDGSHPSFKGSIHYKLKMPQLESTSNSHWVGWEKNERNKMGPRLANMKESLDPSVISENAVNLNLKLMKWNILPDIDLEKLKKTRCLLLGSGTLGCSVARTLLGWGVRNITFVDNSTVSFSNPVRQSLFTYQDSVEMKPKSHAAAENLSKIFPGVNSKGFQISIPMPGHTIGDSMVEHTVGNVQKLTELVKGHDVIFLLMDSRESRWLPSLLGNVQQKMVINAALGFDSFLVMRHGIHVDNGYQQDIQHREGVRAISGADLGCYFCNDVTAPGNSLKNRTLDQQCTVTRPGVSQIAGALAVELAVSLLQHKEGVFAPAFYSTSQTVTAKDFDGTNSSILGIVPHSIRGFLSSYEQLLPATQKYKNCVACSEMIIKEYKTNGIDFLMKVFNSSKHLEDVALLTDMLETTNFADILEFDDEDDVDD